MLIVFTCIRPQIAVAEYDNDQTEISISIAVYEDVESSAELSDILSTSSPVSFKDLQGQINFGTSRSSFWFRIDIPSQDTPRRAFLEVGTPLLDQLDIFTQADDNSWQVIQMGDTRALSSREIIHPHFLKEIKLAEWKEQRLFLRVQSDSPISVPIKLWLAAAFQTHDRNMMLLTGLYFGALLALIIFNSFIYLSIRDRSYLFYVGYLGFMSLFVFAASGLLSRYVLPDSPQIANRLPFFFLYLAIISGFKFAKCINNTSTFSPGLFKIIKLFCFVLAGLLVLGMVTGIRILSLFTPYLGIIALGLGMQTVVVGIRAAYKPSYFVGCAFLALIIGGVPYAFGAMGLISEGVWTTFSFKIGVAIEALLLAFALAYRIRYTQDKLILVRESASLERAGFEKKVMETQDKERRQIATELHDGLGQNLLVIKNKMGKLSAPVCQTDTDQQTVDSAQELIQETINDIRDLSHRLHPHILDRLGLKEATIGVIQKGFEGSEIQIQYRIGEIRLPEKSAAALHIYRIVQEGVKNILLHARPVRVEIELEQFADSIELRIEDFVEKPQALWLNSLEFSQSFGLSSIRERVELLMGQCVFSHNDLGGFRIDVVVPFTP